jgi:hypothetical protein
MNSTAIWADDEMSHLAAIVIYDHYQSGCRAMAFLDRVAGNFGGQIHFRLALWPMDGLAYPGANVEVIQDLGRSKILIWALHTGGELPKSVFDWVECWAHCRAGGDSALVILGNSNSAAVEELGKIAKPRGITLFCEPTTQPGSGRQSGLEEGLEKRGPAFGPILRESPDPSRSGYHPHWGLNE